MVSGQVLQGRCWGGGGVTAGEGPGTSGMSSLLPEESAGVGGKARLSLPDWNLNKGVW